MLNGLLPFLIGLIAIIFRKEIARLWVKQQFFLTKREWPVIYGEIGFLIGGIIFIIIGLIDLLKYFSGK